VSKAPITISVSPETDGSLFVSGLLSFGQTLLAHLQIQQEVSVLIASDVEIQRLNREFRNLDVATDVLTFPSLKSSPFPLGDVAISLDMATRQAEQRGCPVQNELAALLLHGVLHLMGYDDESESDKLEMQQRMSQIASELGLEIDAFWFSAHYNLDNGSN
jgi:probable rRNA maturation factor